MRQVSPAFRPASTLPYAGCARSSRQVPQGQLPLSWRGRLWQNQLAVGRRAGVGFCMHPRVVGTAILAGQCWLRRDHRPSCSPSRPCGFRSSSGSSCGPGLWIGLTTAQTARHGDARTIERAYVCCGWTVSPCDIGGHRIGLDGWRHTRRWVLHLWRHRRSHVRFSRRTGAGTRSRRSRVAHLVHRGGVRGPVDRCPGLGLRNDLGRSAERPP